MKKSMLTMITVCALSLIAVAQGGSAQESTFRPPKPIKLSGPRAGLTYIGGDLGKYMRDNNISQYISQVGWQFETRYFETRDGLQGLIETVILLGGFETDQPVLSLSLLVGFRTRDGFEAGVGPSLSTAGEGTRSFVFAVGHTYKNDNVYIPINFAIDPSAGAVKYTFLVGFILRKDRD